MGIVIHSRSVLNVEGRTCTSINKRVGAFDTDAGML